MQKYIFLIYTVNPNLLTQLKLLLEMAWTQNFYSSKHSNISMPDMK